MRCCFHVELSWCGFSHCDTRKGLQTTEIMQVSVSQRGPTSPQESPKGGGHFCTVYKSPKLREEKLSGCINVTVR